MFYRGHGDSCLQLTDEGSCPMRVSVNCTGVSHGHIFDCIKPYYYTIRMSGTAKKITINLPVEDLERAQRITGKGITSTIIEALHELERSHMRSALRALKGKVGFDLDLEETRT